MRKIQQLLGFVLPLAIGHCNSGEAVEVHSELYSHIVKPHELVVFQLTLKNGDQMAVNLLDKQIAVNDGRVKRNINSSDILELTFNGVLQGTIKDKAGNSSNLGLSFVENSHVTLKFISSGDVVRCPWSNVDSLEIISQQMSSIPKSMGEKVAISSMEKKPLLADIHKIEIPEIEFKEQPTPMLQALENFEIMDVEFKIAAEGLLKHTGEFDIPEVEFITDAPPHKKLKKSYLAGMSREEVIAFAKDIVSKKKKKKNAADGIPDDPIGEPIFKQKEIQDYTVAEIENVQVEENNPILSIDEISISLPQEEFENSEDSSLMESLAEIDSSEAPSDTLQQEPLPIVILEGSEYYIPTEKGQSLGYYISRKKVTNREYQKFVNEVGYKTPYYWKGGKIPFGLEDQPVVNITYKDILLFSVWAGKRLPTIQELNSADAAAGALVDSHDGLNEWTSTPKGSTNVLLSSEASMSATMGGNYSNGYLIYGSSSGLSMHNGESNALTGFRLVSDEH